MFSFKLDNEDDFKITTFSNDFKGLNGFQVGGAWQNLVDLDFSRDSIMDAVGSAA